MDHVVDSEEFWPKYYDLPEGIQDLARSKYQILKEHPKAVGFGKLCDTKAGPLYRAEVTNQYRALALKVEPNVYEWFWIGTHEEYNRLVDLFC